jgi:endoglucanase
MLKNHMSPTLRSDWLPLAWGAALWLAFAGGACATDEPVPQRGDGVAVVGVGPVAPHIVALTLHERSVERGGRTPYLAHPDDLLVASSHSAPAWTATGIAEVATTTRLQRMADGEPRTIGFVYQPRPAYTPHVWQERTTGSALNWPALDQALSYRLQAIHDPAAAAQLTAGIHPQAVYRKSKPRDGNDINGDKALIHRLYLVFDQPLREGVDYQLNLGDPIDQRVRFTHDPRRTVNEAIHVNHIGYRPDDPFKRGYLSLWMGNGGGLPFAVDHFELIDATTEATVFRNAIQTGFPSAVAEGFAVERNHVGADVHYLDFHAFAQPGQYRVFVPGIGVSLPFSIGDATWSRAFQTAMHGFLSHRSGIELGPPLTTYRRPRPMHPADGVAVYPISYTMLEGEAPIVRQAVREMMASGIPVADWPTLDAAWGGYMDAGDWDRRSQHLTASLLLAELFAVNPDYFAALPLALPANEAMDHIPDLLNEVLWNVAFFRRLQQPDGGVRGGIESTQHPRTGEASWEESLVLGAFAADPYSSYNYTAAAALLAAALTRYDAPLAAELTHSAERAWAWAENHGDRVLDEAAIRSSQLPADVPRRFVGSAAKREVNRARLIAAGALYALTGDEAAHQAFIAGFAAASDDDGEALGAGFRYALLPVTLTDPATRRAARNRLVAAAERALAFGTRNAFGLHSHTPDVPMMGYTAYYSVPEMVSGPILPRAYLLTGDPRYLQGAVHAAHFSAGANPLNKTFTTGVGHDFPRNPLHIDSRVSGQPAPAGITIYGPMDAAADYPFNAWVHQWHLQDMLPASRAWPAAEWHIDLFRWPAMSEYTIHQTMRPTAYYWGFLAARPPVINPQSSD